MTIYVYTCSSAFGGCDVVAGIVIEREMNGNRPLMVKWNRFDAYNIVSHCRWHPPVVTLYFGHQSQFTLFFLVLHLRSASESRHTYSHRSPFRLHYFILVTRVSLCVYIPLLSTNLCANQQPTHFPINDLRFLFSCWCRRLRYRCLVSHGSIRRNVYTVYFAATLSALFQFPHCFRRLLRFWYSIPYTLHWPNETTVFRIRHANANLIIIMRNNMHVFFIHRLCVFIRLFIPFVGDEKILTTLLFDVFLFVVSFKFMILCV